MDLKKIASLTLFLIPGFGLYKELKKPKEKRKIHSKIGWGIYSSGAILKLLSLPVYVYVGKQTGDWTPINILNNYVFEKDKEETKTLKKKNLEKTIYYEAAKKLIE